PWKAAAVRPWKAGCWRSPWMRPLRGREACTETLFRARRSAASWDTHAWGLVEDPPKACAPLIRDALDPLRPWKAGCWRSPWMRPLRGREECTETLFRARRSAASWDTHAWGLVEDPPKACAPLIRDAHYPLRLWKAGCWRSPWMRPLRGREE